MAELAAVVGAYRRLVAARVRSDLQYRLSFALALVAAVVAPVLDFVALVIIFRQLPRLGGWSLEEIALLYGISGIAFAFADLLAGPLERLPAMLRDGSFDQMLTRPMSTLVQVLASDFATRRVGRLVQAAAVLVYALRGVPIEWDAGRIVVLVAAIASGAVIFVAVFVAGAAVSFWTVESIEALNAFTYGGSYLTSFPFTIFGAWLRRFATFALPLAFVAYLPALYLLGRHDPAGLPDALRFAGPPAAALSALAAGTVWHVAVRHYRSTGS